MITCYLRYEIDPEKVSEFEAYAKAWVVLVERHGGQHHGYFLPHEGPNDLAIAAFSFPSLAAYETYRRDMMQDPDCLEALDFAAKTGCMRRHDRYFLRPLTEGSLEPLRTMHRKEGV